MFSLSICLLAVTALIRIVLVTQTTILRRANRSRLMGRMQVEVKENAQKYSYVRRLKKRNAMIPRHPGTQGRVLTIAGTKHGKEYPLTLTQAIMRSESVKIVSIPLKKGYALSCHDSVGPTIPILSEWQSAFYVAYFCNLLPSFLGNRRCWK